MGNSTHVVVELCVQVYVPVVRLAHELKTGVNAPVYKRHLMFEKV